MRKELENRLIKFSVALREMSKTIGTDNFEIYLIDQLLRSSASAALNYGEAQGAESKKDFIHKTRIVLKELRETNVNLKIISEARMISDKVLMDRLIDESHQLVSIFHKTVQTARKNLSNS